jgi:hypothetical protein
MREIRDGGIFTKPEDAAGLGFTGGLWEILEQCLLDNPKK